MSAYVRLEGRYDAVYSQGFGMFPSVNTYGDRSERIPERLRGAVDTDFGGVIEIREADADACRRLGDDAERGADVGVEVEARGGLEARVGGLEVTDAVDREGADLARLVVESHDVEPAAAIETGERGVLLGPDRNQRLELETAGDAGNRQLVAGDVILARRELAAVDAPPELVDSVKS